jgi:hypothetical protein
MFESGEFHRATSGTVRLEKNISHIVASSDNPFASTGGIEQRKAPLTFF